MKTKDLSNIMKRAWAIFRETGKSFSICLVKAWELYRLVRRMRNGVVGFAYEKKDGTLRKAQGTLREVANLVKGTGVETPATLRYFDLERNAFRCFRVANLVCIY